MISKVIIKKLDEAFSMSNEFITVIEEGNLKLRIPNVRSNTIGGQIVCIARARDAYSKCILNDEPFVWRPDFDYNYRYDKELVGKHLQKMRTSIIEAIGKIDSFSDNQTELLLDLLSHEMLHQGQLIRYIYANELTMPSKVKAFWHLED